jgi:DNA-binding PadR family transcriptional regulator
MSQQPKLTTTSHLILGHLALREWSTYELTQQLQRSTRHYWPRAASKIYEEPRKLVAHGLATAREEHVGRRPRTVYRITAKGRRALRRWLDVPPQEPAIEFEGAVKVLFAEHGTKEQALATVRAVRDQAEATLAAHASLAEDLTTTGGPFPHRLHLNELVFKFMWEQARTIRDWAGWAEERIAGWPDDIGSAEHVVAGDVLREARRAAGPAKRAGE